MRMIEPRDQSSFRQERFRLAFPFESFRVWNLDGNGALQFFVRSQKNAAETSNAQDVLVLRSSYCNRDSLSGILG